MLSDRLLAQYRAAADAIRALLTPQRPEALAGGGAAAPPASREAARRERDAAIGAIRGVKGYEDFFLRPTWEKIAATVALAVPLVYLAATPVGGLALVVRRGDAGVWTEAVWLDGLTEMALRDTLVRRDGQAVTGGYLAAYGHWRENAGNAGAREAWFAALDETTRWLWDAAMGRVVDALKEPSPSPCKGEGEGAVVLIPAGLLALLPLHAAWTEDAEQPLGRHYFLDEFIVSYAPSARALHYARAAAAAQPDARLLAINEPRPVDAIPLLSAQAEIDAIAALFATPVVLRHEQANLKAIREALPPADIVHFACHGANDWANPLESGLCMAHDQLLTVRDLLGLEEAAGRLATLSACETGIVGTGLPDEVVALPSALLQVGFGGVVASLWSVADISTAMLMAHFYHLWQEEKLAPAQALRAAQRWLRDTTNAEKGDYFKRYSPELSGMHVSGLRMPEAVALEFFSEVMSRDMEQRDFAHPFWWAAFCLTGV